MFNLLLIRFLSVSSGALIQDPTAYEVSIYDMEVGGKMVFPIPMSSLKIDKKPKCWRMFPDYKWLCCYGLSITKLGVNDCFRGDEYALESDNKFAYLMRKVTKNEFNQYSIKLPNYQIDIVFYIIEKDAYYEDRKKGITILRENTFGLMNVSNLASHTVHFYCPVESDRVIVWMRQERYYVNFTMDNETTDPNFFHLHGEIPTPRNNSYSQVDFKCFSNSTPVTLNLHWMNKPFFDIQQRRSRFMKFSENVSFDAYDSTTILMDRMKIGRNVTCYVTPQTLKVYWSRSYYTKHFAIQYKDKSAYFIDEKYPVWYIPGDQFSPTRFILQYRPDEGSIAQIFCSTFSVNFIPVTIIFGGDELTDKQRISYELLKLNNLTKFTVNTKEMLRIRCFIPHNISITFYRNTPEADMHWRIYYPLYFRTVFSRKYDVLRVDVNYTYVPYEQIAILQHNFAVDAHYYIQWIRSSEENDETESSVNPLMEPQGSLSGLMVEIRTETLTVLDYCELCLVIFTAICVFGVAASFLSLIFYFLLYGSRRFDEESREAYKETDGWVNVDGFDDKSEDETGRELKSENGEAQDKIIKEIGKVKVEKDKYESICHTLYDEIHNGHQNAGENMSAKFTGVQNNMVDMKKSTSSKSTACYESLIAKLKKKK